MLSLPHARIAAAPVCGAGMMATERRLRRLTAHVAAQLLPRAHPLPPLRPLPCASGGSDSDDEEIEEEVDEEAEMEALANAALGITPDEQEEDGEERRPAPTPAHAGTHAGTHTNPILHRYKLEG